MNMQQHNDGGPAFPHLRKYVGPNTYEPIAEGGMSLRDWFAGLILQGSLNGIRDRSYNEASCAFHARMSYEMADAMLAERNRSEVEALK